MPRWPNIVISLEKPIRLACDPHAFINELRDTYDAERQLAVTCLMPGATETAAGVAAGMIIAALTTRAMTSLLHGVTPLDPVTFVAAPVLLMAVASVAALIPAIRATRVDAVPALRAD